MGSNKTALFVMPRSSRDWKGAEGLWITTAGWAAAAKRRFGEAYVLTTDRAARPEEVVKYPLPSPDSDGNSIIKRVAGFFPKTVVNLVNDILLWKRSKGKNHYSYSIPGTQNEISLVWEQHDIFPGPGYNLAKKYNAPYVVYVHAPSVWEAKKWGVKRPFWGELLQHLEARAIKKADFVACVSELVSEKVQEMGISKEKIMISPMAIDPFLYLNIDTADIVEEEGLNDKFVVGWTGSFRSFHGVDLVVEAFKKFHNNVKNSHLLLVGDGLEKEKMKELVIRLDLENFVSFPGRMSFRRMTKYVNTFDLAVLSASKVSDFHYSPMKLREYLKAGKATLAPKAGEIPNIFTDHVHLRLYKAGNVDEMAEIMLELYHSASKREEMGREGRRFILEHGTWDVELAKLMFKIGKFEDYSGNSTTAVERG